MDNDEIKYCRWNHSAKFFSFCIRKIRRTAEQVLYIIAYIILIIILIETEIPKQKA